MPEILSPPILKGTEAQQLAALRDYLVYVSRQFDTALEQVDDVRVTVQRATAPTGGSNAVPAAVSQQVSLLRQMIINNATIVRSEIDQLSVSMTNSYEAIADDLGSYKNTTDTAIAANGANITQVINDISEIDTDLEGLNSNFQNYIARTQGYIRYGVVDRDEEDHAVIGIAIGQTLKSSTTETVDGEVYDVIDPTEFRSVFTANELSFFQDDHKVAYLSNNRLFITDAEITGKLNLGNWEINRSNGFSIKWIGG